MWQVMATDVRTISELEAVGTIVKLLRQTNHHGFPVTAHGGGGGVLGIIRRDQLVQILQKRQACTTSFHSDTELDSTPYLPYLAV